MLSTLSTIGVRLCFHCKRCSVVIYITASGADLRLLKRSPQKGIFVTPAVAWIQAFCEVDVLLERVLRDLLGINSRVAIQRGAITLFALRYLPTLVLMTIERNSRNNSVWEKIDVMN